MQEMAGLNFLNEDEVMLCRKHEVPDLQRRIETETVCCVRCQTPHCRDCWSYMANVQLTRVTKRDIQRSVASVEQGSKQCYR